MRAAEARRGAADCSDHGRRGDPACGRRADQHRLSGDPQACIYALPTCLFTTSSSYFRYLHTMLRIEVKTIKEKEQLSCSELTGFGARSERCCGDLERLSGLRDLALPGDLPGRG